MNAKIRAVATKWKIDPDADCGELPNWTVVARYLDGRELKGAAEAWEEEVEEHPESLSPTMVEYIQALYAQFVENHANLSKLLWRSLWDQRAVGAAAGCYVQDVLLVQSIAECVDAEEFEMLEEHV